ncbi:hypothetical protein EES43_25050 [Streptomyces sp. ADI96-02]|uniref:protein phosphatase 2C domain-containing protein n=1 Tax=Streptomyces sp. ADI96-02 TaxID=1522760 RepID=UPI000F54FE5B|nr:protein phosphatase 2C domain-containing protein [Streptomyces sp. ADI96-02]RPK56316.1 hypothetical protein EES43_25050 [Streptomyces sp. ADI96-02]
MSQQGEKPAAHEDDWWRKLYDETASDTGPGRAADSLDDRFDSASDTVGRAVSPRRDTVVEARREPRAAARTPTEAETETEAEVRTESNPQPRPDRESGTPGADPPPAPVPDARREPDAESEPLTGSERSPSGRGPQAAAPAGVVPEPRDAGTAGTPAAPAPPPAPPRPAHAPPPQAAPLPQAAPAPPPPQAPPAPAPPASPPRPPKPPRVTGFPAPWEAPVAPAAPSRPRTFPAPAAPPDPRSATGAVPPGGADGAPAAAEARPVVGHLGDRPPTYDPEPAALPAATAQNLDELAPDTVLDGARYGTYTLRAASVRGDSARFRGEPRRDALLTARFGSAESALVLIAVAGGSRSGEGAQPAAADAVRWIGRAVARSHVRLSADIRAGRRADLTSGLHRLTDRTYGNLRARAAELGLEAGEYTAGLRCLLLSADPACRTRVFFGVGAGGLFRLRDGVWHDLDPWNPEEESTARAAAMSEEGPDGDRLTMDLQIAPPPPSHTGSPVPPPARAFRFRASAARPGDTLLLCSNGFAEPMRGEPELPAELARRWGTATPPGLPAFLADTQLRIKGYADDRTCAAVWEA